MVHVKRIDVQRLLGFKDLRLELDSQIQLIAGPNNAGKSSLVRILELFFSDPHGDEFQALKPLNDYYRELGARCDYPLHLGLTESSARGPSHRFACGSET